MITKNIVFPAPSKEDELIIVDGANYEICRKFAEDVTNKRNDDKFNDRISGALGECGTCIALGIGIGFNNSVYDYNHDYHDLLIFDNITANVKTQVAKDYRSHLVPLVGNSNNWSDLFLFTSVIFNDEKFGRAALRIDGAQTKDFIIKHCKIVKSDRYEKNYRVFHDTLKPIGKVIEWYKDEKERIYDSMKKIFS